MEPSVTLMLWPVVFSSTAAMALIGSAKLAATATWASAAQAVLWASAAKSRAVRWRTGLGMGTSERYGARWWKIVIPKWNSECSRCFLLMPVPGDVRQKPSASSICA
ncbi:hypothetical protein D9M68_792370 [compost metagenome]